MRDALFSGSLAGALSGLVLAACGKAEIDDPWAPLNGPSQWVWGRHAKYKDRFTVRHTVVGYAIHHAASIFWAVAYEALRRRHARHAQLEAAIATSATAAIVDYNFTPRRFMPGFEKRLSRRSLVAVYAAFALGLAGAALLRDRR